MNRNRKPADFAISLDDSSRHWLWVSVYWNWPDFKWSRRRGWTTWWVFVPIKCGKRPPRTERLIRMSEDKLARRGGEYGMGSGNVQECTQEQLPEMTKNLCYPRGAAAPTVRLVPYSPPVFLSPSHTILVPQNPNPSSGSQGSQASWPPKKHPFPHTLPPNPKRKTRKKSHLPARC